MPFRRKKHLFLPDLSLISPWINFQGLFFGLNIEKELPVITSRKKEILGFSSSSKAIKKITIKVISFLQDYPRGDIVVSLAVLWLGVCERFDVCPHEVLSMAERMRTKTFDNKHQSQFKALKEYFENDL